MCSHRAARGRGLKPDHVPDANQRINLMVNADSCLSTPTPILSSRPRPNRSDSDARIVFFYRCSKRARLFVGSAFINRREIRPELRPEKQPSDSEGDCATIGPFKEYPYRRANRGGAVCCSQALPTLQKSSDGRA